MTDKPNNDKNINNNDEFARTPAGKALSSMRETLKKAQEKRAQETKSKKSYHLEDNAHNRL